MKLFLYMFFFIFLYFFCNVLILHCYLLDSLTIRLLHGSIALENFFFNEIDKGLEHF